MYHGRVFWPGFRVVYLKRYKNQRESPVAVDIAEPAFYWRVRRDYVMFGADKNTHKNKTLKYLGNDLGVPLPTVVSFDVGASFNELERKLSKLSNIETPRLLLHMRSPPPRGNRAQENEQQMISRQRKWADDSVGQYDLYDLEMRRYGMLPQLKYEGDSRVRASQPGIAADIVKNVRLCARVLEKMRGNRSCFDKCD